MEGDESKPPFIPDDSQLSELTDRAAENVVEFQQFADEIVEAIDQDEKFLDMTAKSYDQKKAYMKSHIRELSELHNSLAGQYGNLIEELEFQQLADEIIEAIDQDEKFLDMTAESYNQKKVYMKSQIRGLSELHNSLVDQYRNLIEELSKNSPSVTQNQHLQSSESSSSPQLTQTVAPNFSRATGLNVLLQPNGSGFYLSKVEGAPHSGLETSMSSVNKPAVPPVNDDALKVEETKDSGSEASVSYVSKPEVPPVSDDALKVEGIKASCSETSMSSVNESPLPPDNDDALNVDETKDTGLYSSMSHVNKNPVPPVDADALNIKGTKDSGSEPSMVKESNEVLLENISRLEEVVASFNQKLQSARKENRELKQEMKENRKDIGVYMSASKREMKAMKEELQATKKFAKRIDEHMSRESSEKLGNQVKHDSDLKEMNLQMTRFENEISQLKSTHEKKEKFWNGVTAQLKDELNEKSKSLDDVSQDIEALIKDTSDQNNEIHKLKAELISVKLENVGLMPSFENVQKITDELKLKVVELETEVNNQMEAMSEKDRE